MPLNRPSKLHLQLELKLIVFAPILVYQSFQLYKNTLPKKYSGNELPDLPINYTNFPWAKQYFEEFGQLETEYRDFIIWRRLPFSGETINIDQHGIRKTAKNLNITGKTAEHHFFGGSSMWGTGVTDELTIPSILSLEYGINAINYGESGYLARQSMAMMINQYSIEKIEGKDNTIVFYDGVNDVLIRCRSELSGIKTQHEKTIQSMTQEYDVVRALNWIHILEPAVKFIDRIKLKFIKRKKEKSDQQFYDCSKDKEKAIAVAKSLVNTWHMSSVIASEKGDKFVAILQPVAYLGAPNIDHMPELSSSSYNLGLKKQYQAVYPLIRRYAHQVPDLNFLDFSHVYDSDDPVYIDFCHVSPQGHYLLLDEIEKKHKRILNL